MKRTLLVLILVVILSLASANPVFAYPPPESSDNGLDTAKDALTSRPRPGYGMAYGWRHGESVILRIVQGFPFPPGNPYK